jgi:hypothetical protein
LQEGCTATITAQRTVPQHRPDQGGCLELAPGLEPGSAVYKTAADRPPRAGLCCPCSSGRMRRPASALLSGRVALGGMTGGMTAVAGPAHGRPRVRQQASGPGRGVRGRSSCLTLYRSPGGRLLASSTMATRITASRRLRSTSFPPTTAMATAASRRLRGTSIHGQLLSASDLSVGDQAYRLYATRTTDLFRRYASLAHASAEGFGRAARDSNPNRRSVGWGSASDWSGSRPIWPAQDGS